MDFHFLNARQISKQHDVVSDLLRHQENSRNKTRTDQERLAEQIGTPDDGESPLLKQQVRATNRNSYRKIGKLTEKRIQGSL